MEGGFRWAPACWSRVPSLPVWVGETILGGLADCQNNLVAHLRDWIRAADKEMAKPTNTRWFDPTGLLEEGTSPKCLHRHR